MSDGCNSGHDPKIKACVKENENWLCNLIPSAREEVGGYPP